ELKLNRSPLPQTSLPPSRIVQLPPPRDWLPARAGVPISQHFHPLGQLEGGGRAVLMLTVSKVTVPRTLALWEVTARPARTDPFVFSATLDPATGAQVVPLLEV